MPGETQQFTVTPRDTSTLFEDAHAAIVNDLSAIPEARVIDVDPRNRIAIVEVPAKLSAQVHSTLKDRID